METLSCIKEGWTIMQAKLVQEGGGRCINGAHNNFKPIHSKTTRQSRQEQCCRSFDDPELEDLVKWQVSLLRATPLNPYSVQPERKKDSNHLNSSIRSETKPYFNLKGEIDVRAALTRDHGTTRRKKLKVRRRIDNLIDSDNSQALMSPPFVSNEDPLVVKSASRMQQGTATPLPLSLHSDGPMDFTDSRKETLFDNRPLSPAIKINKIGPDQISVRNPCADMDEKKKKKQRLDVGGSLDVLADAIGVLEKQNNGEIDDSFPSGWFGHAGVFFRQKRVMRRAISVYKRSLYTTPNSNTVLHTLPGAPEDEVVNFNENRQQDELYCQTARIPAQPLIWSNRGRSRSLPAKYHDSVLVHPWKKGSRKNTSESLVKVH